MRTWKETLRWVPFYLPALALTLFFILIPVAGSFYYALTDWNGLDPVIRFIGPENFVAMISDDMFLNGLRNTFVFALSVTVIQNCAALALAAVVDAPFPGREAVRVVFFAPAVLSALVVGYSWAFILNPLFGALNSALAAVGLGSLASDWLGDPKLALASLTGITVWQFTGYSMVIYLAGMQGVPKELYEAADIDGAGRMREFFRITFPLIAPSFTINILLSMIGTMKAFDLVYVTTNGGPGYATETISTVLYKQAFQTNRMGYGTAIAVVLFVIILAASLLQLKVLKRREELYL